MSGYEEKKVGKSNLPEDVPSAGGEQGNGVPDGAIYRADNGQRFRLRHARWVPVVVRKPKGTTAKPAQATAAKR